MAAPVAYFAAATLIGTGLKIIGQRKASDAEEAAARKEAELKRQQAFNILERFEMNEKAARRKGESFKQSQIGAFASSGAAVGEGSSLLALEQTNRTLQRAIDLEKFEAEAQANALLTGADFQDVFAEGIKSSKDFESLGLFFSGAARAGSLAARGGSSKKPSQAPPKNPTGTPR